jgi:hypothetical protein
MTEEKKYEKNIDCDPEIHDIATQVATKIDEVTISTRELSSLVDLLVAKLSTYRFRHSFFQTSDMIEISDEEFDAKIAAYGKMYEPYENHVSMSYEVYALQKILSSKLLISLLKLSDELKHGQEDIDEVKHDIDHNMLWRDLRALRIKHNLHPMTGEPTSQEQK